MKTIILLSITFLCALFAVIKIIDRSKKESQILYFESELEPGIWPHNDAIASILIREDLSSRKAIDSANTGDAWTVVKKEIDEIPDSIAWGERWYLLTNNNRRWEYEIFHPNKWAWLIKLPLIRFLKDEEFRNIVESTVYAGESDSDSELMVACCLLHSPQYHYFVKERGKKRKQTDTEQAEKLLLSSAQKGNTNAMFELACLYHAKGDYEKVIEFNNKIKAATGRSIWFVERFEKTIYKTQ